jgi:two-component sensor histidine kinase
MTHYVSFHHDITDEKKYLEEFKSKSAEAMRLQENLDSVQKLSKTALSFYDKNGNYYWTNELMDMLDANEEERSNFTPGFHQFVVDEDKSLINNAFNNLSYKNPSVEFTVKIKTFRNNFKFFKVNILYKYDKNNEFEEQITYYHDVTKEQTYLNNFKEKSKEALRLDQSLKTIQTVSQTAIAYQYPGEDTVWSSEIYDILEISPEDGYGHNNLINKFALEEDRINAEKAMSKVSPDNPSTSFIREIMTPNKHIKFIKTFIKYEFGEEGNIKNRISFNQDISDEIKYQHKLENALADREYLLKEVHDQVKNNLQVILSLMDLEKRFKNNKPDEILNDINLKIITRAVVHEKIHVSDVFSEVNLSSFIGQIVESTLNFYGAKNITVENIESDVDIKGDNALPVGLILNELTTNVVKYAFPHGETGKIFLSCQRNEDTVKLLFKDNGVGLPDDFSLENLETLGLIMVDGLVKQINGDITIRNSDGVVAMLEFKD